MSELDVVNLLRELVRTPSPSGAEGDVAGLVKDFLLDAGVDEAFIDDVGNVVARLRGGGFGPVLIEGHLDTVDPGNLEQWHVDPFAAKVIDGRLYGRGAADMKGGIASQVSALAGLREIDLDLYVVYTVHEETAEGVSIARTLSAVFRNTRFEVAITGEATSLNLGVGHRGRAVIDVRICGRSAHASMPEEGVNALLGASEFAILATNAAQRLPEHSVLGKETLTPSIITCSPEDVPQIPDQCVLTLDHRVIVSRSPEDVVAFYDEVCKELLKTGDAVSCQPRLREETIRTWTGVDLKVCEFFPAWLNKDRLMIKEVLGALKKSYQYATKYVWRFSTDLAYVSGVLGVSGLGLGPGDESMAHKPDEYVEVIEVRKAVELYRKLLYALNDVITSRYRK